MQFRSFAFFRNVPVAAATVAIGLALSAGATWSQAPSQHKDPATSSAQRKAGKNIAVEMHNVMYHFTDEVAVHIRSLRGEVAPTGEMPIFDDKNSFVIQIAAAEIAISTDNMANVLNSYVFAASDAPLKS